MPEILDLDNLLSFIRRTNITHKSASLATSWTSSQFVLPKAFRHIAPFQVFLHSVGENALSTANELIKLSYSLGSRPADDTRNVAVLTVKSLLDRTLEQADRERTMFIAAQVISDFEELWQNPFGEISTIFPGSGAAWFLGAYRRGLPPTKRKNEVTTDTKICRNIVSELQQRSSLEMECFGCYIDDDGRVRNKLNDRLICAIDGEHMSCKGAIRINRTFAAYRISRRISPAQPSFHPVRYDPGWPQDVYEIAAAAVKAYITLVEVQR
jgi:hypothetical protein